MGGRRRGDSIRDYRLLRVFWIAERYLHSRMERTLVQCITYGVVIGVAGMVGDLAESLIKRDCGQKDSSRWMPGFGGVLDLIDSILLAAPVAMVYWATTTIIEN